MRRAITGLGLVLALGLPGSALSGEPDHAENAAAIVAVTPERLLPTVSVLGGHQTVAWLGYTSRPFTITFEREVAKHMHCDSPSVFTLTEAGLEATVSLGGFALFCQLDPGEYPYQVRVTTLEAEPRTLVGRVIVE